MKFLHLADLHIGKRLNEFSLIEDQVYILNQILEIMDKEKPFGVIIAGDVYDKSIPSTEAVKVLDEFLWEVLQKDIKIFMISGNHDSAERLAFGSNIMSKNGLYISNLYNGIVEKIPCNDGRVSVNVHLLPFVKPLHIKKYYPDSEMDNYTDAIKVALRDSELFDKNILVAHQFVTGSKRTESEEISVGGLDNVDTSAFEGFDYVALGHIHKSQALGKDTIRYSGTPLKYSFSEAEHEKSVTVIEIEEDVTIHTIPLIPKYDLREIKGKFEVISEKSDDYLHIILTNEEEIQSAMSKLRVLFPNIMKLSYDNKRTRGKETIIPTEHVKAKSPLLLFAELYEKQNGQPLTVEQENYMKKLIEEVWEESV